MLPYLLWSCSDRPSGVLDEKKMVSLLVDMEIAEAYSNNEATSSHKKLEIGQQVLESHGVSEESLDTTLAWYGRNMDEYTALFDKVDEEILRRKKKYDLEPIEGLKVSDNLWPYSSHLVISPLSEYDALIFSIPQPEIEKGDIIKLSFSLPNPNGVKGTFGVEYSEGDGESIQTNVSNRRKIEVELQTDTSKSVARLFGFMTLKDVKNQPVYIDSISIITESLDSLNYRSKKRSQKHFGVMLPQKTPEKVEADTVVSSKPDQITPEGESGVESSTEVAPITSSLPTRAQHTPPNPRKKRGGDEFEKLEKNK